MENSKEINSQSNEIEKVLLNLTNELRKKYPCGLFDHKVYNFEERQIKIMIEIKNIICNLAKDIVENKKPVSIVLNRNSWDNCVFHNKLRMKPNENCIKTEIKLSDKKSLHKFSLVCFLLSKIYVLLKTEETCTKRELYYRNVEVLNSQSLMDSALNDISYLLDAPLYDMNIHATSKGLIYGQVILKTSSNETDCSYTGGTLIPPDVFNIIDIETEARLVLLIEKDTVFQRLLDDDAMSNLPPCVFITGKGFPDINTRALLKKIWDILSIPILALVDPDPWGIEIMCIYRFGSLTMSHSVDNLAVPSVRWLGVFPSEVATLSASVRLEPRDRARVTDLLMRPYTSATPRLQAELTRATCKAETETMDVPQGYLAHKYIPSQIAAGNFI